MLTAADFRELVSGRRGGIAASLARATLLAAETPYTLAVRWRNWKYDRSRKSINRVAVPVVSVGNLTLGGTGKTPMVKWLARELASRGRQPAIVSRGYGAVGGHGNDEARELRQALPDVPHVQDRDRVAAACVAVDYHGCDVVLLDDGFQHRRLARDLDIVLLDALEPFGFDHVFPRGTLREPADGLRRANVVCLSRADAITEEERRRIRDRATKLAPHAVWCEVTHAPSRLVNTQRAVESLDVLRGSRIAAFCGIGNPAGFRHTLAGLGGSVTAFREFADHHAYSERDVASLSKWAGLSPADVIICTAKDLVKLRTSTLADKPLWAVDIEIAFLVGKAKVAESLANLLSSNNVLRDGNRDIVH
jgi:tetraacyldisaccharide 4'-kinase